jgi:5-methylcytosine-specific restriction endonuclease McrA
VQALCPEPFEVDHIIPRSARGATVLSNLCLACPVCNNAKQDRLTAIDPFTGKQVQLFIPVCSTGRDISVGAKMVGW